MLIFDKRIIGNKLLAYRKKSGLTQMEVAEKAGLSNRTYADIERGSVNMRTDTLLFICQALSITPDDIFTDKTEINQKEEAVIKRLNSCSPENKKTALDLLTVYLDSIS